jgi:hypothetical protein
MTTAKSIPEMTAAYQEWTTKQLELLIAEAKMIFEHTQDFAKTYTEIVRPCTIDASTRRSASARPKEEPRRRWKKA